MSEPDIAAVRCPVCGHAAGDQAECARCRWTLRSAWRAGVVDATTRAEFEALLATRIRRHDTQIVARVSAELGPYSACVRNGPPTAQEWADARRAAQADVAAATDDNGLRAALGGLLSGLAPETTATVIDVGIAGIAVLLLRLDQHGTPTVSPDGDPVPWSRLLRGLPSLAAERFFRLAAGTDLSPDDGRLGDPLAIIPRPRTAPGDMSLVVCRPAGWDTLEQTAALLAARRGEIPLRVTARADAEPVAAVLRDLADGWPLTRAYQLLVADIDGESGAVRTRRRPLFAAGARPGAESTVPLRRLPGDQSETTLAIFAEGGAEPLALYAASPPAGLSFQLHARLGGPGRVLIDGAEGHQQPWSQIRAELPKSVAMSTAPADLVCAVHMAGPNNEVRARQRLAVELLELLAAEYAEPDDLRVAVVACGDHEYGTGTPRDGGKVVHGINFSEPAKAAAWVAGLPPEPGGYVVATPVEDLLEAAAGLLLGSRREERAARLVTIAGRLPHPARDDPYATTHPIPCPHRYEWPQAMKRLTSGAATRCTAVYDTPRKADTDLAAWREIGPHGAHVLPSVTPRRLAEELGLLVSPGQSIPLPIPD